MHLYSVPGYVESLIKAYEETVFENAKEYDPKEWED